MTQTFQTLPDTAPPRPLGQSIFRGVIGRCPACGTGRIFKTFLTIDDHCPDCQEELFHHRADDGPPFFSMFFMAPLVVLIMIIYEIRVDPPVWHHLVLGVGLSIPLCILPMRPIKGAFLGIQWAYRMHNFGSGTTQNQ